MKKFGEFAAIARLSISASRVDALLYASAGTVTVAAVWHQRAIVHSLIDRSVAFAGPPAWLLIALTLVLGTTLVGTFLFGLTARIEAMISGLIDLGLLFGVASSAWAYRHSFAEPGQGGDIWSQLTADIPKALGCTLWGTLVASTAIALLALAGRAEDVTDE